MSYKGKEIHIQGQAISRGIAVGRPYFFSTEEQNVPDYAINEKEIALEVKRFHNAVQRSREEIIALKKRMETEGAPEGAAILDAHLQMLEDPLFTDKIPTDILEKRRNAEAVLQCAMEYYEARFEVIKDPFFRERVKDVWDVAHRVFSHLLRFGVKQYDDVPEGAVVFAYDFSVSDVAELYHRKVAAFISEVGGATSHAAIVAKAQGIPYISGIKPTAIKRFNNLNLIVDGRTGALILAPSKYTSKRYKRLHAQLVTRVASLEEECHASAETYDGYGVDLLANVEMLSEVEQMIHYGAQGIGLFRSEFLFLTHNGMPTEEEQADYYEELAKRSDGRPLVIRTFDIGGDKFADLTHLPEEDNPLLGCRAIRYFLRERDLFKMHLRAIIRASAFGNVHILLPMISGVGEVRDAKGVIAEVCQELDEEGVAFNSEIKVGCMIEVPSAAVIADLIAAECDFISIGTNDLAQYSLAVDRTGEACSSLYEPMHPSVIRLIHSIATQAKRHHIPVSVCGEVAADPRYTPLILGLGVRQLSVATRYLPVVKHAIRSTSIINATELAEAALSMATFEEVEELLTQEYKQTSPEDALFNI